MGNQMQTFDEINKRKLAEKMRTRQMVEFKRRQQKERQRKLTIYDTKQHQSSLSIVFYSKILKLEINNTTLIVCSKDIIFVFSLKDMQQIKQIKAANHLLRISLSPNYHVFNEQNAYSKFLKFNYSFNLIAVCDNLEKGIIKLYDIDNNSTVPESGFYEIRYATSIQMFKFNINGNLIGVLESQSNVIKINGVPDGTTVAKLVTNAYYPKASIVDISFCPNTTFVAVLWCQMTEGLRVDIFDISKQVDRYYIHLKNNSIVTNLNEESRGGLTSCFFGTIGTLF